MASARPMAMIRFSAKIDTSVNEASARIIAIEPTIANPPTASGTAAASTPPNTQTRTRKLSGSAIASMVSRSRLLWSLASM